MVKRLSTSDRRKAGERNTGKQIVWVVAEKRNMRVKTREQNNGRAEDGVVWSGVQNIR